MLCYSEFFGITAMNIELPQKISDFENNIR